MKLGCPGVAAVSGIHSTSARGCLDDEHAGDSNDGALKESVVPVLSSNTSGLCP